MCVLLIFKLKIKVRYDVLNFIKVFEDVLVKGGLFEDDYWIEYDLINKGELFKFGEVYVIVNV